MSHPLEAAATHAELLALVDEIRALVGETPTRKEPYNPYNYDPALDGNVDINNTRQVVRASINYGLNEGQDLGFAAIRNILDHGMPPMVI